MSEKELKDWRGTPIEVGSTIVYPVTSGSYQWVCEAEITAIEWVATWRGEDAPLLRVDRKRSSPTYVNPGKTTISRVDRVTVVA